MSEEISYSPDVDLLLAGVSRSERLVSVRPEGLTCWGLQFLAVGACEYPTDSGTLTANAGDLILSQPKIPLFYRPVDPTVHNQVHWVLFQPPAFWSPLLRWPEWSRPGIMRVSIDDEAERIEINECFEKFEGFQNQSGEMGRVRAMHELQSLLIDLRERYPDLVGGLQDARIEHAVHHMQSHLHQSLDVSTLARKAGLSTSRFAALFQEQTGEAPMEYLTRLRMQRACVLLGSTPMLIKQVASEVGYPQPANFTARFRQELGCSPRQYRKKHTSDSKH